MVHGLNALKDTLQSDKELNINNCSIGIVGKGVDFYTVDSEALQGYIDKANESSTENAMETDSRQKWIKFVLKTAKVTENVW